MGVTKEELYKALKHEVRGSQARIEFCSETLTLLGVHQSLENTVILVLANKNDLKGALSSAEISEALGLSQLQTHQWHIQSCCALTGDGLEAGMDWVAQRIESQNA